MITSRMRTSPQVVAQPFGRYVRSVLVEAVKVDGRLPVQSNGAVPQSGRFVDPRRRDYPPAIDRELCLAVLEEVAGQPRGGRPYGSWRSLRFATRRRQMEHTSRSRSSDKA